MQVLLLHIDMSQLHAAPGESVGTAKPMSKAAAKNAKKKAAKRKDGGGSGGGGGAGPSAEGAHLTGFF